MIMHGMGMVFHDDCLLGQRAVLFAVATTYGNIEY